MTVFVQKRNDGRLDTESSLIYRHCTMERITTRGFLPNDLLEGNLDLTECQLLVGSVEAVAAGLHTIGVSAPSPNYYPKELSDHLYRTIWETTPKGILGELAQDREVFAKSYDWKKLTGQVFTPSDGAGRLLDLDPAQKLVASEVVVWLVEYRVYVLENKILACCYYDGDESLSIDVSAVEGAVERLSKSPGTPVAYAFDWGILASGKTALVEMNDAWAIGAYQGIGHQDYYRFLKARWDELACTSSTKKEVG